MWENNDGRYEITALAQTVSVPAGTFEGCVEVMRWNRGGTVTVTSLYAPGVGNGRCVPTDSIRCLPAVNRHDQTGHTARFISLAARRLGQHNRFPIQALHRSSSRLSRGRNRRQTVSPE